MSLEPEIRIVADRVTVRQGRKVLQQASLPAFLRALAEAVEKPVSCPVLPKGVRILRERRDAVAVALEVPPQARTVRWLAADSEVPFGRRARYERYFLSFPYVVIALVLRRGDLTGAQQLYYRRDSLDAGEDLLLPNLYNVAKGHGQRCWVCLQHVGSVGRLPWPKKLQAISDHVFSAAFNRSSELHEGNSYWSSEQPVDPCVATPEAWQEATRHNPWFTLDVPWRPAGTTLSEELESMLTRVVAPLEVRSSTDLSGLVTIASRSQGRE